jgi:hypothetical protein
MKLLTNDFLFVIDYQAELVGLSFLLLIEDSERDSFAKFLSGPSQRQ